MCVFSGFRGRWNEPFWKTALNLPQQLPEGRFGDPVLLCRLAVARTSYAVVRQGIDIDVRRPSAFALRIPARTRAVIGLPSTSLIAPLITTSARPSGRHPGGVTQTGVTLLRKLGSSSKPPWNVLRRAPTTVFKGLSVVAEAAQLRP